MTKPPPGVLVKIRKKGENMDFIEKITQFSRKIEKVIDSITTEEATKTSIILPFFQILGYDVFDPCEFVPEFTADVGAKKGEKVDYAIMIDNNPLILVEAKPASAELGAKHMNQLLRYFTVTKAKFAILTNGIVYKFYSDLEEKNKMDSVPFLEFNLLSFKKDDLDALKKFQKDTFNLKSILNSASDLKYFTMIKNVISDQFNNPSDQLVKVLINKNIYSGAKTQAVLDKFKTIVKKAFDEYINDTISERLSNVISPGALPNPAPKEKNDTVLSEKEIEMLDYIKNIIDTELDIKYRKTSRYVYMQLGEVSAKWICRVYIRKEQHLLTLHKFEDTDYECEYYFDDVVQLEIIHDVIKDTFEKCRKL